MSYKKKKLKKIHLKMLWKNVKITFRGRKTTKTDSKSLHPFLTLVTIISPRGRRVKPPFSASIRVCTARRRAPSPPPTSQPPPHSEGVETPFLGPRRSSAGTGKLHSSPDRRVPFNCFSCIVLLLFFFPPTFNSISYG